MLKPQPEVSSRRSSKRCSSGGSPGAPARARAGTGCTPPCRSARPAGSCAARRTPRTRRRGSARRRPRRRPRGRRRSAAAGTTPAAAALPRRPRATAVRERVSTSNSTSSTGASTSIVLQQHRSHLPQLIQTAVPLLGVDQIRQRREPQVGVVLNAVARRAVSAAALAQSARRLRDGGVQQPAELVQLVHLCTWSFRSSSGSCSAAREAAAGAKLLVRAAAAAAAPKLRRRRASRSLLSCSSLRLLFLSSCLSD